MWEGKWTELHIYLMVGTAIPHYRLIPKTKTIFWVWMSSLQLGPSSGKQWHSTLLHSVWLQGPITIMKHWSYLRKEKGVGSHFLEILVHYGLSWAVGVKSNGPWYGMHDMMRAWTSSLGIRRGRKWMGLASHCPIWRQAFSEPARRFYYTPVTSPWAPNVEGWAFTLFFKIKHYSSGLYCQGNALHSPYPRSPMKVPL